MNTKWNLDGIYMDITSKEFKSDFDKYKNKLEELNLWTRENFSSHGENDGEKLETFINMKNELLYYSKLELYVALRLAVDTTNEELIRSADMLEQLGATAAEQDTALVEFLKGVEDIEALAKDYPVIEEHKFFLEEQKNRASHTLSADVEKAVARMKNTGSVLWQKQWEQLTSTLTIPFEEDGEVKNLPLSQIRNLAYSADANVRKRAYEAELDGYKKIERAAAFSMNGIKGEVITLCNLRGWKSPLEMTLIESRLDDKILGAMWSAVESRLPKLQEYFVKKANILGHDGKLPFYDLFAPVGEDMKFTVEQARDFVIDCFYGFSKELGDFAKKAFDENWIDLMPSEGKVGGAFCEAIHPIKQSRVMTNFGGTFNDVVTIAHELGHAFHDTLLYDASELNSFYPMPIAETASTFCEAIVVNAALKKAEGEQARAILENDLQGLTQSVVDIYSRFLFESEVFDKRVNGSLSANEMNEIMLKAQKKAYGKGLDENYLNSGMWVCKPHYYDADFNFYNFPYAFGVLLSKALYAKYEKEGEDFVPLYYKLLGKTSTLPLGDVAKIAGCDLYDEEFWNSGLDLIIGEIEKFK
jgi:pepF/M3 family oligoendopeptidase